MQVLITAVHDVTLPKPFSQDLAAGVSLPATYIRLKDVMSDDWLNIVRMQQEGKITVSWDVDNEPVMPEDEYFLAILRVSGTLADAVADVAALKAITQANRENKQTRYVTAAGLRYRFEAGAPSGGETPNDIDDGRWFVEGSDYDWGIVGEMNGIAPSNVQNAGALAKMARIDHRHSLATGVTGEITGIAPGNASNGGALDKVARVDHTHILATGLVGEMAVVAPDNVAGAGAVAKVARVDHVHALSTGVVGELVGIAPANVAGAGVVNKVARIDHTHTLATGVVGELVTVAPNNVAGAGVVNKVARIDHTHSLQTGLVAAIQPVGTANGAGAADTVSRADHVHALAAKIEHLAAIQANMSVIPFEVTFDLTGLAAEGKLWDANVPVDLRITGCRVLCTGANALGTVTLFDDDPSGAGVAISDAIPMAVDKAVTYIGSLDHNKIDLAAAGTLWYKKNAAGDTGAVILTCVRR